MRIDLLDTVIGQVDGYHLRRQLDYDYESVRFRLVFEALTQGVQYVCNNAIAGDIGDFGTMTGFTPYTIARAMRFYQKKFRDFLKLQGIPPKTLYLFDSFAGLPPPVHPVDAASPYVQAGRWKEGTFTGLTEVELHALCESAYNGEIRVIAGWFKDTLPALPPATRFAMVHLDCDLYSSTMDVLDQLFSRARLTDGSMICFDDWNCNRSSPRFGQRRAWKETVEKYSVKYSDCGDYGVLGHKFIVHLED